MRMCANKFASEHRFVLFITQKRRVDRDKIKYVSISKYKGECQKHPGGGGINLVSFGHK